MMRLINHSQFAIHYSQLSKDFPHHLAVYVRQAEGAALERVGEVLVVEAEQVQDGGLQVVNVNAPADAGVADLIGLAVCHSGFDAAAGQPHRKDIAVMIAPDVGVVKAGAVFVPIQLVLLIFGEPHGLTDEIGVIGTLLQWVLLIYAFYPGSDYQRAVA